MSLRLALFDFDGTLVDSGSAIVTLLQAACRRAGLAPPGPAAIRMTIGLPLADAVRRLMPELEPAGVSRIVACYAKEYEACHAPGQPVATPLFDGALAALAALETSMLLGIATGKSRRGLALSLEHLGLDRRFVVKMTADDGPAKPHPAIVQRAMAAMGVEPGATIVIGDTSYDMEMAKAAGVSAIGVSWGYHSPDALLQAGADRVIDRFDELPTVARALADNEGY